MLTRSATVGIALLSIVAMTACADDDTSAPTRATPSSAPTTSATIRDEEAIAATREAFVDLASDEPGCTVAVGRDGQVVFAEAYGVARLDPLTPMTTGTVVDIGSTSKQFTATAILLLEQRGELDLDAALSIYLPDVPAWAGRVTIRQMLHHTSGIPDYVALLLDEGFAIEDTTTDADALAALGSVAQLAFEPGSRFEYSNSNYFLLGQVVLAVTGDDLAAFLASEVFGPLGLDAVMDPTGSIPHKAVSYARVDGNWEVADSGWEQLGDGAVQTTPSELVKWASQYWDPTLGGAKLLAARFEDAVAAPDLGGGRYGAGIIEIDVPGLGRIVTHGGGWGGFVTAFTILPDAHLAFAGTCTSPDLPSVQQDPSLEILSAWAPD